MKTILKSPMSVIPCHRGGHLCNWPACPEDCDGRPGADAYSTALDRMAVVLPTKRIRSWL